MIWESQYIRREHFLWTLTMQILIVNDIQITLRQQDSTTISDEKITWQALSVPNQKHQFRFMVSTIYAHENGKMALDHSMHIQLSTCFREFSSPSLRKVAFLTLLTFIHNFTCLRQNYEFTKWQVKTGKTSSFR